MSCVSNGVTRVTALLLLMLAGPAAAGGETRLGNLIRFYLAEKKPSRQFELVEKIRELVDDDVTRVMAALRAGEHRRHVDLPVFLKGGTPPRFSADRPRVQEMRGSEGDLAQLILPVGYDPKKAHALMLDLGAPQLPVPDGTVVVRVAWARHPQAREAMAVEGLVLSLLARTQELVHIDPDRVVLRAIGKDTAAMAWYIALHNPDRFAGVVAGGGSWSDAERLAENSRLVPFLAIERRRGDPWLQRFFGLPDMSALHKLVKAPRDAGLDKQVLYPPIIDWQPKQKRGENPTSVIVQAGRETTTRAFWVKVAPRRRTIKRGTLGGLWAYRGLTFPGTLVAEFDQDKPNLIHVRTHRVTAFRIFVDPAMFDVSQALRVRINGGVPIANLIDHNLSVEAVLEDYKERRDSKLLYAASFPFSVRRDSSKPPTLRPPRGNKKK